MIYRVRVLFCFDFSFCRVDFLFFSAPCCAVTKKYTYVTLRRCHHRTTDSVDDDASRYQRLQKPNDQQQQFPCLFLVSRHCNGNHTRCHLVTLRNEKAVRE